MNRGNAVQVSFNTQPCNLGRHTAGKEEDDEEMV